MVIPVMAADTPTSKDMTDPLTYILKFFKGGSSSGGSGQDGPAGPQGPAGLNGLGSFDINGTFTLSPGLAAYVVNIGNSTNGLFDFYIPQGVAGPQGPAGEQGPQGIQGVNGTPGDPGPQGIQGPAGEKGDKGDQGDPGAQGPAGEQGPQGIPGAANMTAGPQGPAGEQGPQGEQGLQGIQGIQGIQGETGATGAQGPPGPMDDNIALINGTRAFTANLSMGGFNINNLATPSISTDAATKGYVDASNTSMKGYADSLVPDVSQYFFINGTRNITATKIFTPAGTMYGTTANTDYLQFIAGDTVNTAGASITMHGKDRFANGGYFFIRVPDAAKTSYKTALTISGDTDTPTLDVGTYRVTNLGEATTANDALRYNAWTSWNPSPTYSGCAGSAQPPSQTNTGRYVRIGKTIYYSFSSYGADSNACTGVTVAPPFAAANTTGQVVMFGSAYQKYWASGTTYDNIIGYVKQDGTGTMTFLNFHAMTDEKAFTVAMTGFYEIA